MLDLKPYYALVSKSGAPLIVTATEYEALLAEIEELRAVLAICLPLARDVSDIAVKQFGGKVAIKNEHPPRDKLVNYIQRGNKLIEHDGEPSLRLIGGTVKIIYDNQNP